jgi:hypothetical protein
MGSCGVRLGTPHEVYCLWLIDECHVAHRVRIRLRVRHDPMPNRQRDRGAVGMTDSTSRINTGVASQNLPAPLGGFPVLLEHPAIALSSWTAAGLQAPDASITGSAVLLGGVLRTRRLRQGWNDMTALLAHRVWFRRSKPLQSVPQPLRYVLNYGQHMGCTGLMVELAEGVGSAPTSVCTDPVFETGAASLSLPAFRKMAARLGLAPRQAA